MNTPALQAKAASIPEGSGVAFGRSADDMPVARVGDFVFAMVPGRDGQHFLASAWRVSRQLYELNRDDFYSHHGAVADEPEFRARMIEQAEHVRDLRALDRQTVRMNCSTPWGPSQGATVYAEGIVAHTTAGHGGFKLSNERNAKIHPMLGCANGWYEEDAAWAAVALTYPSLFTACERKCADRTVRDTSPNAWEAIFGRLLAPGESHEKDRRAFERESAGDWIVISALRSGHHAGMTEVIATIGGARATDAEERRFLVPSDEYEVGRFGFVIDPADHAAYDGSSSFINWQARVTGP
ncbi:MULTISPECIES: DUF7007 domain-containing protein [Rhizobium]|uniref:DUF7007 domain-containing protein n=1 Tax=Rhizobium TaxID=379 RepID=UPI001A9945DF|nr:MULTISPECIES: hypothetical protein [Rhizobium]MBX4892901.1 hypothetical protein [Rhizobium bangladeshense]MBX4917295.1 hypothetical protein [Rhizobium bangladeshense]MBX4922035.1 hypothetical protein [Rhizobium bangladeshense]MBX4935370.1 hypothetical protein [Rhizobium bangladeshense]MBX5013710.1 hypothetical protein [Rhizobium lentis]